MPGASGGSGVDTLRETRGQSVRPTVPLARQCLQEAFLLLADQAQPLLPAQGAHLRKQTRVAADLLTSHEPPHISNRENENQSGYWT